MLGKSRVTAIPGKEFPGGIDHAGRIETSLMLAINKNTVNMKRLKIYPYIGGESPKFSTAGEGRRCVRKIASYIADKALLEPFAKCRK